MMMIGGIGTAPATQTRVTKLLASEETGGGAELFSANKEINRMLWIPKLHCRAHKNPQLDHILIQINPIQTLPYYMFKIHLILNSSKPSSSK
jgi:hypothetical protein